MAIWVDADACPNVIKEILFRAGERVQMPLTLVANQNIRVPPSKFIRSLRVPAGFDVADNEIVRLCSAEDLVITADIPLAAEVLEKGAAALNPRGERYSPATIREKLTMRDFMDTLRANGVPDRPDSLSQRDRQQFAAELDKWLLEVKRRTPRNDNHCQIVVQCGLHRVVIPYRFAVKLTQHLLQSFLYSLQPSGIKGNTWL